MSKIKSPPKQVRQQASNQAFPAAICSRNSNLAMSWLCEETEATEHSVAAVTDENGDITEASNCSHERQTCPY